MTTAQISRIAPPPSVEAVLGALTEETRIGQVDFSSTLVDNDEVEEGAETTPVAAAPSVAELLQAQQSQQADEAEAEEELESADVEDDEDDGHTAEIVTLIVPEPVVADEPEAVEEGAAKKAKRRLGKKPRTVEVDELHDDAVPSVQVVTGAVQVVEAVAPSATAVEALVGAPATRARRDLERPVLPEPLDVEALLAPGEGIDERPPSIEEIARLVVERMHDAELAMMRHLEAVEVEAARRAELATAQAELDAELIRLNARREAHAIVTLARERAGEELTEDPDQAQLEEITESLTHFADVMEELRPSPRPGRQP